MIEINLLPQHFKKKFNFLSYVGDIIPYLVLVLIVALSLNLLLSLVIAKRAFTLNSRQNVWQKKEPDFNEIQELKQENTDLNKEYDSLSKLAMPQLYFSKIMFLLYENLPINIWFRKLVYQNDVLTVSGSVLDFEKDASLSLRDYVDSLKGSQLNKFFTEFNIKSQDQTRIKDKIVMYFELELKHEEE